MLRLIGCRVCPFHDGAQEFQAGTNQKRSKFLACERRKLFLRWLDIRVQTISLATR